MTRLGPSPFDLDLHVDTLARRLRRTPLRSPVGRLTEVSPGGLRTTLSDVVIGDICRLRDPRLGFETLSQVVAIREGTAVLAPIGPIDGLSPMTEVVPENGPFSFLCGDALLGGVLDGLGRPLDGRDVDPSGLIRTGIQPRPPAVLARPLVDTILPTGVKAIDGLLTMGIGQRVGVFGSPGSGKTTLLGMLARNTPADVCVLALIGERGRELREFLDRQLPPEHRSKCVVVTSTSDRPAMERVIGAHVATAVAEYFRDRGLDVLLLFDSVTRYARALREVGLAAGELPVRRGFTPSVYAELPRLIERSGRSVSGSISAFYTVLVEDDGVGDPIAEEVKSLTDGHVHLSEEIARSAQYPAIDVLQSKSRLMNELAGSGHAAAARRLRALMAKYEDVELLVQVGEYVAGRDRLADESIAKREAIRAFLRQGERERVALTDTLAELEALASHAGG